jgi:hypothetical protein
MLQESTLRLVFRLAAIYNIAWGIVVNLFNDFIWLPFFIAYFIWYRRSAARQVDHGR